MVQIVNEELTLAVENMRSPRYRRGKEQEDIWFLHPDLIDSSLVSISFEETINSE